MTLAAGAALLLGTALLALLAALLPGVAGVTAMLVAMLTLVACVGRQRRDAALAALSVLVVGGAVCALVFPVVAVLAALLAVVAALAIRAPALGYTAALLVAGTEGLLKARLTAEDVPSAIATGAVLVDLLLLITVAGLLYADHGRALRAVWSGAGRAEHVIWSFLIAWLAISIAQVPLSPDLVDAVQGTRLTQLYALLALAGIALFASHGRELSLTRWLLAAFGLVSGYAALRAVVDPPAWELAYAFDRSTQNAFLDILRVVGSFSSVFGLASFLVPVAVFAFILGFLDARVRVLAWVTFALATVGVVQSYVRIGIVAIGVGAAVMAVLIVFGRGTSARTRALAMAAVLAVAGGIYGATLAAGGASEVTETRAQGLSDPLKDRSLRIRWNTWERSVTLAVEQPLGTGLGTVGHASEVDGEETYTDNAYLKILQEQGVLVGLLFFVGIFGSVVLLGRRLARAGPGRPPLAVAATGAVVSFLVLCFLGEYIELAGKAVAWTMLGIALWFAYGATGTPLAGEERDGLGA